ncbi:MAG: FHA domain-containing protein [Pyrinomonadaceae bacterium]
MLRCVRCGTQNPHNSQFCDECGRRLENTGTSTGDWQGARLTMIEETEAKTDFNETMTVSPDYRAGWNTEGDKNVTQAHQIMTNVVETATFAHARLIIERGKNAGKEFVLSEIEVNIGRWDADNGVFPDVDLDADDPEAKVSRRHARIVRYNDQYLVEDLGSTNGTFINRGRRLLPGNRQIIEDGDEIIVGKTFLRFQVIH